MNESAMMLGKHWNGDNPAGWYVSEKMDGCHGYWDGAIAWTRGGNTIALPERIRSELPQRACEFEVFAGRGQFETARLAVQADKWPENVRLAVFDMPDAPGDWMQRMSTAPRGRYVRPVASVVCDGLQSLVAAYIRTKEIGGEGLMIRRPGVGYEPGRSKHLRKVKHAFPWWKTCRGWPQAGWPQGFLDSAEA